MKRMGTWAALAALLAAPAAYAQDDTEVFRQTGQWAVDYGDDYCRLAGTFNNGKDELSFVAERLQPGTALRLLIVADSLKTFRSAEEFGYHFLPSGPPRTLRPLRGETAQGTQFYNFGTVYLAELRPPAPGTPPPAGPPVYDRTAERAAARGVTGLSLDSGWTETVRIETGPLGAPIAALQACADDLLTQWGLDAAKHQTMTKPAMPAGATAEWVPSGSVRFSDFGDLRASQNQFRVMVDATGKPTKCDVLWPSLGRSTNERMCAAILEKGRFSPALDKDGQPMASYWMTETFAFMGPPGGR